MAMVLPDGMKWCALHNQTFPIGASCSRCDPQSWQIQLEQLLLLAPLWAAIAQAAWFEYCFNLGRNSVSCGNCDATYFDFKWSPGCGATPEVVAAGSNHEYWTTPSEES